ncbi:hypothetical protein ACWEN6_28290 [Sphaerisporangium sp. NPDC004334]
MRARLKRIGDLTLAVVLVVLPGAGCADSRGEKLRLQGDDPLIIVRASSFHQLALISGTLTYDAASKCLQFRHNPAAPPATPVWPEGTTPVLESGRRGIDVPGLGGIHDGDGVTGAGGFVTWGKAPPSALGIPGAARCLAGNPEGTVVIFGNITGVDRRG